MRRSRFLVLCVFIAQIAGCTTPGNLREVEADEFHEKGRALDGSIGINDKNEIVIRENKAAQDELLTQELTNTHLRDQVQRDMFGLKTCRTDLSDPRLGGDGRIAAIPDVDALKSPAEVYEELTLDEAGDIRVIREQSFVERLKKERAFEKTLHRSLSVIQPQLEECERRLSAARQKAGLPPQPYAASGYFAADGTWVETQSGERSLDDAFQMRARLQNGKIPGH
jgi:hypothetical protein